MPVGGTIILTREAGDNAVIAAQLKGAGVAVIDYPCIETRLLPYRGGPLARGRILEDFHAVVFSSRRAVYGMAPVAQRLARGEFLLAAVGGATARELKAVVGRNADLVASNGTGTVLGEELGVALGSGAKVLHARGSKGLGHFRRAAQGQGMEVSEIVVYENVSPRMVSLNLVEPVVVLFASPSAADRFFAVNEGTEALVTGVAIGPTTGRRLQSLGLAGVVVAGRTDPPELAACIRDLISEDGDETRTL